MTTAKPLSERNQRVLAQYADGATLQQIGNEIGLTREAVRLIVQKHGGADAEASRLARRAVKDAEDVHARETFMTSFGAIATDIAHQGFTRGETIIRIKTLFPEIDVELAEETLQASDIIFNHDNSTDTFSNSALEAGVWFLLGSELRLKPDHAWAAVNLPQDLLDELGTHLIEASVSPEELATILGVIGAAQRHALDGSAMTITGSRYNELRGELLDAMGLTSAKGAKPWPPTRQTIMKRYGGWNDALESMGLTTAGKGRSKGLLIFSEHDYARAIVDFVTAATESCTEKTFANYGQWVKDEADAGTRRPSPAAIRNFYGAWLSALRKAPLSPAAVTIGTTSSGEYSDGE